MQAYMVSAASHLPRMISRSRIGDVTSNSIVPLRFSSANKRMVIKGMKNSPITLAFESNGRMTSSFRFIGMGWPRNCDSMPIMTK